MTNLREITSRCEAKLHGFRRTADGVVVSFVVHPAEVPPVLALDPLGTRYMLAFVQIGDDEQPIPAAAGRCDVAPDSGINRAHPWYGPCDALGPDGMCAECLRLPAVPQTEPVNLRSPKDLDKNRCSTPSVGDEQPSVATLMRLPDGLLDGLPQEDQDAIKNQLGKPVKLAGIAGSRYEVEFTDDTGAMHTIFVGSECLSTERPLTDRTASNTDEPKKPYWVCIPDSDKCQQNAGPHCPGCIVKREKKRFHEYPLSQQAGMLANDPEFQRWAACKIDPVNFGLMTFQEEGAADYIRDECCYGHSRSELDRNPEYAERFKTMLREFRVAVGRETEPR